jgi:hypothetical protein
MDLRWLTEILSIYEHKNSFSIGYVALKMVWVQDSYINTQFHIRSTLVIFKVLVEKFDSSFFKSV